MQNRISVERSGTFTGRAPVRDVYDVVFSTDRTDKLELDVDGARVLRRRMASEAVA